MANQQQLDLLHQGVDAWNRWRNTHPDIHPDLSGADLNPFQHSGAFFSGVNLSGVNLSGAILSGADLSRADLSRADLSGTIFGGATFDRFTVIRADLSPFQHSGAFLSGANLSSAVLMRANLRGAFLRGVNLSKADLYDADLRYADLRDVNLRDANLSEADLSRADLSRADLRDANLREAKVGWTIFGDVDLRRVKELETITHKGPSTIGTDTLLRSEGDIPETFLRQAGLTETFITYTHSLTQNPIEYYTCFISYSSQDQEFAERLYADLQSKGIRCWFAPEDMKTGNNIRQRIDEAIRLYDKLLLVLSKNSITSPWVEFEVEAAMAKENARKTLVLFPIRLDASFMESTTSWAAHIQRTRHITNFTNWKHHDTYQKSLQRLLRDLQPDHPSISTS